MTIRFTCSECGSVLKIKDELAGTPAKCPKCKTKFVVPEVSSEAATSDESHTDHAELSHPESAEHDHQEQTPEPAAKEAVVSPKASEAEQPVAKSVSERDRPNSKLTAEMSESPTAVMNTEGDSRDNELPLRLDDSDDEIDAAPVLTTEVNHDDRAARPVAISSDDDDDLDSPPVFVTPTIVPKAAEPASSKDMKASAVSEPIEKKTKSALKREDAFDPMKYLMSDEPPKVSVASPGSRRPDSDADLSLSEDINEPNDSFGRPTPQPLSRPSSAGVSTRATPEKVDLATAARMMKKAIKDSQAEAAHQRELEAAQGFDYTLFFREFGMRGVAILGGCVAGVILMLFVGRYIASSSLKLPPLGYVHGTVKMDGLPLADATVYFEPAPETKMEGKRDRARTSIGVTNAKGEFTMMYLPSEKIQGVAVGKSHVWVSHLGEKGEDVPNEWMFGAGVFKDVTAGRQKDPFDISMESRKEVRKK